MSKKLESLCPSNAADCSPSSIYLQWRGDSDDVGEPVPAESLECVTWCADKVFDHDVRYVRWDLVERLLRDVMQIHADPNDAGHNQCDEEKCQWCEWASELFTGNETSPDAGAKEKPMP